MIEWINFIILLVSLFIMCYLYTFSVQPVKRSKLKGEKAWKECEQLRSIAGIFELISLINILIWIWFPISIFNWKISDNYWIGIIIAFIIGVPCTLLMLKGIKDAGSETLKPSPDTKLYGGIYNYIRHPQTIGEFPLFIAVAFGINSWFLVIISLITIIIYIPIMIYYEEKDLVRRFGDKYKEYQARTGAIFPKMNLKKSQ